MIRRPSKTARKQAAQAYVSEIQKRFPGVKVIWSMDWPTQADVIVDISVPTRKMADKVERLALDLTTRVMDASGCYILPLVKAEREQAAVHT